jgi:Family of unknown function (DUF6134)
VNKSCALSVLCLAMSSLPAVSFASPGAGDSTPQSHTYTYSVEHALYGNIGTFSDTVEQNGNTKRIASKLRVAVRILGIVVHREEADRMEIWQGNRLISFHSITTVNGNPIEVNGEARPDGFAITSPSGTTLAPGNIYPSSPWVAHLSDGPALMMSTKTGKLLPVTALGGEQTQIAVHGTDVPVHHYEFITDKRQDVWMDAEGVPVRFRTEQSGKPIDFVLASETVVASRNRQ